jgi:hypothetical protein
VDDNKKIMNAIGKMEVHFFFVKRQQFPENEANNSTRKREKVEW